MFMPKQHILPARWTKLDYHPEQHRLWNSPVRFKTVPAGRRSGKTELAKRAGVMKATGPQKHIDAWYIFAAPTHSQAKRIFWKDLKSLTPKNMILSISESELTIKLINGAEMTVIGLDKAERIEGRPIDWICIDEYGNCKQKVWDENIRPALSTRGRPGEAWLIGVPEGRNHYYRQSNKAKTRAIEGAKSWMDSWDNFHWISEDILDPEEIAAAKRDLDPLTYQQEYEASFLNFEGRAYYTFERELHAAETLEYNPKLPLIIMHDFNVEPGVALIAQEQIYKGNSTSGKIARSITAVIGEVWIPHNSNTRAVARKVVKDWKHHKGLVHVYGDATGGARKSSAVDGSDWDLAKQIYKPVFQEKVRYKYGKSNPAERVRLNSVNSRILTVDGTIKCLVDPEKAPHLCDDFEGVVLKEGGSGEIDKSNDSDLTHISDAFGYYINKKFPLRSGSGLITETW